MAVLTLYISTNNIYIKKLINKLNLTFLFSPLRSNIEKIDTKMSLQGFKNKCSQFKNSVLVYLFLCRNKGIL